MTFSDFLDGLRQIYPQTLQSWQQLQQALNEETWGLPLDRILLATVVFLFFLMLRRPQRFLLIMVMARLSGRPVRDLPPEIRTALQGPAGILPVAFGSFFAFRIMEFDENGSYATLSAHIVSTLVLVAIFWALHALTPPLIASIRPRSGPLGETMADMLRRCLKGFILLLGCATILQEWGVQIAPLLAGMGIVGAALALGAQELIKNLIAGFLILAERRFKNGDWIKVAGVVEGTVDYIGFRSTRVRQFDEAMVEVPNSQFSEGAVVNYTKMRRRRISWMIGVPYATDVAQLKQIRDGIEAHILESGDFVSPRIASTFVRIDSFGASSINIMVYCFTTTTVWGEWLEVKERFAYKVMDVVYGAGSSFAFPSTSLYVETLPADRPEQFLPPENGVPRIAPAAGAAEPAPSARSAAPGDTASGDTAPGGA